MNIFLSNISIKKKSRYTEVTHVFSGMIIECEIMGSRGLVPLAGGSEGGRSRPFLSCMQAILIPEKTRIRSVYNLKLRIV